MAARLAEALRVPHIELDALHHGPNWQEATAEELRARVEEALVGLDGWVADGNYMGKLGTWLIDQADTIVWLDLPLRTLLPRISGVRIAEEIEPGIFLRPGGPKSLVVEFDGVRELAI